MKIIFLDFDGVLNHSKWVETAVRANLTSQRSFLDKSSDELCPAQVKLICDFAIETGARVVISSSWRLLNTREELQKMLNDAGWTGPEILDVTPRSEKGFRGDEVRDWLNDPTKRHVEILEPITHSVIFDDDGDFHCGQPLVITDWEHGVQPEHIKEAREFLK